MTLNNNSPTDNLIREKWHALAAAVAEWEDTAENATMPMEQRQQLRLILAALREKDAQADRDRARIEALEGALREIAEATNQHGGAAKALRIIRAALANTASDNGGQHGHE